MNSNLETASQEELALTDWLRLAGLLIFVAFICFSIVLFCKGANHAPVNEMQALARSLHRGTTKGPTVFNAKRTLDIHRHRRYSATRLAGRPGSVLDQVVSKSVNVLVGMWRHSWETTKVRGRRAAARSNPPP
jgi:hypothetical protein